MPTFRESITIRKCDNLNKQNFWDIAEVHLPKSTKLFYDWIDEYKITSFYVDEFQKSFIWDTMFGNNFPTVHKFKFHHIPFEMQVGIIFRFLHEHAPKPYMVGPFEVFNPEAIITIICNAFTVLETTL